MILVECFGEAQGLMAILAQPLPGKIGGENAPVVCVDFLEAAPWNLRGLLSSPRYIGVGTVMIAEVVRISLESDCRGRVGLHSLPQAERLYKETCKMMRLGKDSDYFDLAYFE